MTSPLYHYFGARQAVKSSRLIFFLTERPHAEFYNIYRRCRSYSRPISDQCLHLARPDGQGHSDAPDLLLVLQPDKLELLLQELVLSQVPE